jgi:mono/diheme cytochrome c family protein
LRSLARNSNGAENFPATRRGKVPSPRTCLSKIPTNQPGTSIAKTNGSRKARILANPEAMMMGRLFKVIFVVAGLVVAGAFLIVSTPARATDDDMAALYNTKCKMCHGATAEKKMDKTKADDVLIQTVLDGKTMEKPPNMPAFKEKGITPDQAKALVGYMKSLQ